MQYATLGHSGIKVSKLCLGGMSFGEASPDFHQWTIGPDETQAVIKRAFDRGINFIDTANCYSFGTSEEYIGRALKNLGIAREDVVLASKVHFNEGGLSPAAIEREIEGSLKRLGTGMDDKTLINLRDAGCDQELIDEIDKLPSTCAKLCRLKTYRRELLNGIHTEQKKLECLDYLIYQLRNDGNDCCRR